MGIKIIIVGGSVAGLSLANMLEKFDIDYMILEAYSLIAPQVGASIGLLPNGLRILDQLGCYERLREAAGNYYHRVVFRDAKGKPISSSPGPTISERMEKHAGYASLWVDRQMLLQILYDNLKQKDKVLTNKRVVHVETSSTGVVVKTEDGSTYAGDILVGGDGVHSKVRQEMWRIASVSDPTAFPPEERSIVQSSMKCIFGISKQPANFPPGATQQSSFFRGHLYLVISAPGGRVYWFLFHELDGTKHGKDIPKFSKDDELLLTTQYRDDHITEDMTFGDLYDNRIKSTLVPLEEHVFRRWHFQRILIIGDAATKVHPIAAQGGNGAIEAAANLVNALTRSEIPSSPDLQLEFIEKALASVFRNSHSLRFALARDDLFFKEVLKQSLAGPRIEKLPAPERPHTTPYNDELPQASVGSSWFGWTTGTLAVVTLGMVVHLAQSTGRLAWMARSR
ncbi:FAD-dependent monooxygenase andE [Colletotrichum siamense]|nr:FAD-dependent monooxygenase andE [Colletotrichum siamense]